MAKRKIIKIDESKCNGCGLCIPNCPEGALQIIDGKARLISDLFCDGLGACIGQCPQGAISIEEREAQAYDEKKVMANIVKQGKNVIIAQLKHLKEHNEQRYLKEALDFLKLKKIDVDFDGEKAAEGSHSHKAGAGGFSGCPGSMVMDFSSRKGATAKSASDIAGTSQLRQWPIQIMLLPPFAPFLQDAHLLIAADCVPFAYSDFHNSLLKGKALLVGCPKLDDIETYREKFTAIVKNNNIKSITYAHMEVPCCSGMIGIIKDAISKSGKDIHFYEVTINIQGERL